VDWRPPIEGFRSRIDVAFTKRKIAVFVDGCFWHGCPEHSTIPKNNRRFWVDKIESNKERDARNSATLEAEGWVVVRLWEHEDHMDAARSVAALVAEQD